MSNVVSISCTCDYLVKRASRHRRAGRYDEAMALLWKARNQFGTSDEVLYEMAQVYAEIGCEEEANRTYLRLVRIGGRYRAEALFHLTVSSAQRGDMQRAASYFEHLRSCKMEKDACDTVSDEMMDALEEQLGQEFEDSFSMRAKSRSRVLEKHALACLQAGRAAAAQRAMEHALRLRPTSRGYTMLACCQLIRGRAVDAVLSADTAHRMSPGNVQTLCVLADAYMACGRMDEAKKAIRIAAMRARQVDDLLSVSVESAKTGTDALTLLLTGRILKLAPFHTRAMMIRACAYINLQSYPQAKRLLGRLCGLLPEDSVCESYYRALNAGTAFAERLSLGLDVTREEAVGRASELVSLLYTDPKALDEEDGSCRRIVRLADWAFHSPMAGTATKTVALVLLASLQSQQAREVLLDLLMQPQISDAVKLQVLQVLTAKDGFYPYEVDMGGKLVRLAAGGVSAKPIAANRANSEIVQRVSDALFQSEPKAAGALLKAFLAYLNTYGHPDSKHQDACAAGLECWYILKAGKKAAERQIAARYGVSVRSMRMFVRRFESCMQQQEQTNEGE